VRASDPRKALREVILITKLIVQIFDYSWHPVICKKTHEGLGKIRAECWNRVGIRRGEF
jgi:hypothetical protein